MFNTLFFSFIYSFKKQNKEILITKNIVDKHYRSATIFTTLTAHLSTSIIVIMDQIGFYFWFYNELKSFVLQLFSFFLCLLRKTFFFYLLHKSIHKRLKILQSNFNFLLQQIIFCINF